MVEKKPTEPESAEERAYRQYRIDVLGRWDAAAVIGNEDIDPNDEPGLRAYLEKQEAKAKPKGIPPEWAAYRERALNELKAVK